MNINHRITCYNCKDEIEMTKYLLKQRVVAKDDNGDDICELFFNCNSCGKHYSVLVTNKEMRTLIERRKDIRQKIQNLIQNNKKLMPKNLTHTNGDKKRIELNTRLIRRLTAEDKTLEAKIKTMGEQVKEKLNLKGNEDE